MRVAGQVRRDACVVIDCGARSWMVMVVAHRVRRGRGGYVRVQVGARVGPVRRCRREYAACDDIKNINDYYHNIYNMYYD